MINIALQDIWRGIERYPLAGLLGWQDIRSRYRRSTLGPLWLTFSMAIMIASIGIVFGRIFHAPVEEFLPFLTIGIILWNYISVTISDGCNSFIASDAIIKQLPIPLFVHILRMMWRNIIILAHNIIIFPLILLVTKKSLSLINLLSIAGFCLTTLNLLWVSLILAIICSRYRDLPQIITSILQVIFYITPIIWMPNLLPKRAEFYLLDLNPIFHLLEIIRAPLLGMPISAISWLVAIGLAIFGWSVTVIAYNIYKPRIAYWL